jgi:hypothetical protein
MQEQFLQSNIYTCVNNTSFARIVLAGESQNGRTQPTSGSSAVIAEGRTLRVQRELDTARGHRDILSMDDAGGAAACGDGDQPNHALYHELCKQKVQSTHDLTEAAA